MSKSSTLDHNHRPIPSPDGGHIYADGFAHIGHPPYVSVSAKAVYGETGVSLHLTPACARELALQLNVSADFCDEVQR